MAHFLQLKKSLEVRRPYFKVMLQTTLQGLGCLFLGGFFRVNNILNLKYGACGAAADLPIVLEYFWIIRLFRLLSVHSINHVSGVSCTHFVQVQRLTREVTSSQIYMVHLLQSVNAKWAALSFHALRRLPLPVVTCKEPAEEGNIVSSVQSALFVWVTHSHCFVHPTVSNSPPDLVERAQRGGASPK